MGFPDGGKEGQNIFLVGIFWNHIKSMFSDGNPVMTRMFVRGFLSMIINQAEIVIQNYNNPDDDVEGHNSISEEICTT